MNKRFELKDYLEIAIIVALIIVLGFFFYALGRMIVFPGSKMLTQAVFISFMFACILHRVRKMGTLTLTCFVFGGIMSFITIIMGIVILLSAFIAEFLAFVIFREYHDFSIIITAAVYSTLAFILTLGASVYITGSEFGHIIGNRPVIIHMLIVAAFLLGCTGSYLGVRLMNKRLQRSITLSENS